MLSDGAGNTASATLENCILGQHDNTGNDFVANTNAQGNMPNLTGSSHDLVHNNPASGGLPAAAVVSTADPLLAALANNGGPTMTMALMSGSPAVHAGVAIPGVVLDQRGVPRITPPDLGAFELSVFDPAQCIITISAPSLSYGATAVVTLQTKDGLGHNLTSGGLTVVFGLGAGTSGGSLSTVSDNHDGTYTATFLATTVGTPRTLTAAINGVPITSMAPTVTVTPVPLTITAVPNTKSYDGTTSAAAIPTVTGLLLGDTVIGLAETYATSSAGTGKALFVSSFTLQTVNSGSNYQVILVPNTAGVILPLQLTITAMSTSKTYGQTLTFAGTEFTAKGLISGDMVTSVTLTSPGTAASATINGSPYPIIASAAIGTGLDKYMITYVTGSLTVNPKPLTITANSVQKTYGQTLTFAGTEFTANGLVNGDMVTSISLTSAGAAATATVIGSPYPIFASHAVGMGLGNYTIGYSIGTLTVSPKPLTVTANNVARPYGAPNPPLTVSYSGFVNGDTTAVLSGSPSVLALAVPSSAPGPHPIIVTQGTLMAANYTFTFVNGTLTVIPPTLWATGVNINAIAGAPFRGVVATFINAFPQSNVTAYTATITWGDGHTSAGTITDQGNNMFAVNGSNTYAAAKSYTVSELIQYTMGSINPANPSSTATVTSLGITAQQTQVGGVNFWKGVNGQALINSFNGGASATMLSSWLATSFPNLYGANAGSHNLTGMTNAQVAGFDQQIFNARFPLDSEVLAMALNVYATTLSLGGTAGQAAGFTVSANGLGAYAWNVGASGAAFGVMNNTTLNVYQLLLAANNAAVGGVLWNNQPDARAQAFPVFTSLNEMGSVH